MWDAKVEEGAEAGAGVVVACIAVVTVVVRVIAVLTQPEKCFHLPAGSGSEARFRV